MAIAAIQEMLAAVPASKCAWSGFQHVGHSDYSLRPKLGVMVVSGWRPQAGLLFWPLRRGLLGAGAGIPRVGQRVPYTGILARNRSFLPRCAPSIFGPFRATRSTQHARIGDFCSVLAFQARHFLDRSLTPHTKGLLTRLRHPNQMEETPSRHRNLQHLLSAGVKERAFQLLGEGSDAGRKVLELR